MSSCNDALQDVTDRVRCKVRSPLDRFLASIKEPLFESVVSIWAMPIREGRQGVNACLDGLEHFFST